MLYIVAVPIAGAKVALFATQRRPFHAPRGQLGGLFCCPDFLFIFDFFYELHFY